MAINIGEPHAARLQRELDQLRARQETTEAHIETIEAQVVTRTRDLHLLARFVEGYLKRRQQQGQVVQKIGEAMMIEEPDEVAIEELVGRLGAMEERNAKDGAGGAVSAPHRRVRRRSS